MCVCVVQCTVYNALYGIIFHHHNEKELIKYILYYIIKINFFVCRVCVCAAVWCVVAFCHECIKGRV